MDVTRQGIEYGWQEELHENRKIFLTSPWKIDKFWLSGKAEARGMEWTKPWETIQKMVKNPVWYKGLVADKAKRVGWCIVCETRCLGGKKKSEILLSEL